MKIAIVAAFMAITFVGCSQADKPAIEQNREGIQNQIQGPVVIDVAGFQEKMNAPDVQIIDVRTDAEVAAGFIAGATQMDVLKWDNFVASTKTLDSSKPVLVYCKSGGRSNRAATYLVENGFIEVYDLDGGITKWNAVDGEVVKP